MLAHFAIASAIVIAFASPAEASVTYDPQTKTGFAGEAEVRKAFGWTGQVLASRASGLEFSETFATADTYQVICGKFEFPVVHQRDYGRYDLIETVAYDVGYGGKVTGFRISGAESGISGTAVAPAVGDPCPEHEGSTIDKVRLVSSTTEHTLTASSGSQSRTLSSW